MNIVDRIYSNLMSFLWQRLYHVSICQIIIATVLLRSSLVRSNLSNCLLMWCLDLLTQWVFGLAFGRSTTWMQPHPHIRISIHTSAFSPLYRGLHIGCDHIPCTHIPINNPVYIFHYSHGFMDRFDPFQCQRTMGCNANTRCTWYIYNQGKPPEVQCRTNSPSTSLSLLGFVSLIECKIFM